MAKRRVAARRIRFKISPEVRKALEQMKADGRKVRVLGQVRKGFVEIDHAGLAQFAKMFPKSTLTFVALNAPFKTSRLTNSA